MGTKRSSQSYQHTLRHDKDNDACSDNQASHTSTTHTTLKRHGHTGNPTRMPRTLCLCNPSCEFRTRPTLTINSTRPYATASHVERRANLSVVLQRKPNTHIASRHEQHTLRTTHIAVTMFRGVWGTNTAWKTTQGHTRQHRATPSDSLIHNRTDVPWCRHHHWQTNSPLIEHHTSRQTPARRRLPHA